MGALISALLNSNNTSAVGKPLHHVETHCECACDDSSSSEDHPISGFRPGCWEIPSSISSPYSTNRVLRNFWRRSLATRSSSSWSGVLGGGFKQGIGLGGSSGGKKQDVKQPISFMVDLWRRGFLYFQEGLSTIRNGQSHHPQLF